MTVPQLARILQGSYSTEELVWTYQLAEARSRSGATLLVLNPRIISPALFEETQERAHR